MTFTAHDPQRVDRFLIVTAHLRTHRERVGERMDSYCQIYNNNNDIFIRRAREGQVMDSYCQIYEL